MPFLAGTVTPQDFAATGLGAVDDSAAINSAVQYLAGTPNGGGTVQLPPGSYLLNGATAIALNVAGVVLAGSGAENTKIIIGSGFSAAAAVQISAYNCQVRDLSVSGQSSTTTSNPVANGIEITAARRAKVDRCTFFNVNGWAIEAQATNSSSTSNPHGTQISKCYMNACAGGVHFLGNTTQGYAVNSQVTDLAFYSGGVTSGGSANLDAVRIEDAWDVLLENTIAWMSSGTGSCLHVKGNCAATFITNFDALGPSTGPCVLIEDGINGSVQNCQITQGVIQQGTPGLTLSGGSNQIHISTVRFISNQTHGATVSGTASPVHLSNCSFNLNGAGASGTNYDVNWSGTAKGHIVDCWLGSPIVATGTAGVQQSINIGTAGQAVTAENVVFAGTGATSTNWFTNAPDAVLETGSGFNFATAPTLTAGATVKGNLAAQPSASGNTVLSGNVNGAQSFDQFRLTGDGTMAAGSGTAARDTNWGRLSAAVFGSSNSDIAAGLAGKGFRAKEGTNAKQGTATLASGTVTVTNTSVTASSRIFLTIQSPSGTVGSPYVFQVTAGTSFVIKSTSAADNSTVAYEIFEPA